MKKNGRIYIRVNPDLKEKVQEFCDRKHTTISDLIGRFLARVIEEDKKQKGEAPQI